MQELAAKSAKGERKEVERWSEGLTRGEEFPVALAALRRWFTDLDSIIVTNCQ